MLEINYPFGDKSELTLIHFVDFLDMCEGKKINAMKLKLKVSFIDELFATASTCDFHLGLPIGHGSDRNNFVDALIMSFNN